MNGWEYEYYCAGYLRQQGFSPVYVTSGSGDQGVDVVAHKGGLKYAVQCKHYRSPVNNKAVQQVYAGAKYYDCDRCIVITSSTFTKSARELAQSTGVELWEGIVPDGNAVTASQAPQETKAALGWALAAVIIMLFVSIGIFTRGCANHASTEPPRTARPYVTAAPSPAPAPTTAAPSLRVGDVEDWEGNVPDNSVYYTRASAKEMLLRFRQDPAAAAETYDGQHLKLTGFLSKIDPAGRCVALEEAQFAFSDEAVRCLLSNDEQLRRVETLTLGQYVTVWGVCTAAAERGYTVQIHCISP